jgi:sulfoxide reductase heme-binding subunit YedZ
MNRLNKKTQQRLLKLLTHVGALIPLALLIWDYNLEQFGADPIREVTLRTGKAAITLLVLSLAITPFNIWFGWKQLHPLRKLLGLYAFLYVGLHLTVFFWLDYGLNLELISEALFEKRYALVGSAAFLILLPLAATSTRWAMRKMGRNWTRLHRWVYLAGILAVLHYVLLVKNAYTLPFLYAVVLALLLLTRVKPIKQAILRFRRKLKNKRAKQTIQNKKEAYP